MKSFIITIFLIMTGKNYCMERPLKVIDTLYPFLDLGYGNALLDTYLNKIERYNFTTQPITEQNFISDKESLPALDQTDPVPRKQEQKKVYYCPITTCNQKFSRSNKRNRHLLQKHPKVLKPFSCKFCISTHKSEKSLDLHLKRKHSPLIYKCFFANCNKKYALKSDWTRHLMRDNH